MPPDGQPSTRGNSPVATDRLMDPLVRFMNVREEHDGKVQALASRKGVALIAFVSPYIGVRVSPIEEAHASISLPEEFGVEELVNLLKTRRIKKAFLLVNSPGGSLDSSYKIARAIRTCLEHVVTFVPHIAASGGTLLALTGNEIVMGPMSHISPLDPQSKYKSTFISAASFMRFFSRSLEWFEKITPEEAPYPMRALTDKFDPILMEEFSGWIATAQNYVSEILRLAGHTDHEKISELLVTAFPTHDYVITPQMAKDRLLLNIKQPSDYKDVWPVLRNWLRQYILQQEARHHIRYSLPQKVNKNAKESARHSRKPRQLPASN